MTSQSHDEWKSEFDERMGRIDAVIRQGEESAKARQDSSSNPNSWQEFMDSWRSYMDTWAAEFDARHERIMATLAEHSRMLDEMDERRRRET